MIYFLIVLIFAIPIVILMFLIAKYANNLKTLTIILGALVVLLSIFVGDALRIFLNVQACWASSEPFEIFSDDGSYVFVFIPEEYSIGKAHAALYEIVNDERRLVYMVEGLSSFAFESNFYFSNDMMHFARRFPPSGMNAFEVFSYGVRTRVVLRSDFIRNYAGYGLLTSIGPDYTIGWRIDEHATQDTTITINTDEGIIYFDLATATFDYGSFVPIATTQTSLLVIGIIIGIPVVLTATGILLLKKRTKIWRFHE